MLENLGTILVADDDQQIRDLIKIKLIKANYTVMTAADGAEVLQILNEHQPDLIILDINMPRLDGYAVTEKVRANPILMHIPILLLTARDQIDDKVKGMTLGADDYIVKPFEIDELEARIKMHLRRAKRDREVNPLTMLPGSPTVERVIEDRLDHWTPFAACYIDLDNFKSFNDRYGFVAGNDIIRLQAETLVNVAREYGTSEWLVAHIGGDDFILLASADTVEEACAEIITRFDAAVPKMYAPEDRNRGFIWTENRRGVLEKFGFVSISIAVVLYDGSPDIHLGQIGLASAELKHLLKAHPGSIFMVNRRAFKPQAGQGIP